MFLLLVAVPSRGTDAAAEADDDGESVETEMLDGKEHGCDDDDEEETPAPATKSKAGKSKASAAPEPASNPFDSDEDEDIGWA